MSIPGWCSTFSIVYRVKTISRDNRKTEFNFRKKSIVGANNNKMLVAVNSYTAQVRYWRSVYFHFRAQTSTTLLSFTGRFLRCIHYFCVRPVRKENRIARSAAKRIWKKKKIQNSGSERRLTSMRCKLLLIIADGYSEYYKYLRNAIILRLRY